MTMVHHDVFAVPELAGFGTVTDSISIIAAELQKRVPSQTGMSKSEGCTRELGAKNK